MEMNRFWFFIDAYGVCFTTPRFSHLADFVVHFWYGLAKGGVVFMRLALFDLWKSLVCDGLGRKSPRPLRALSVSSRAKDFRLLKMAEINGLGVSIGILENRVGETR